MNKVLLSLACGTFLLTGSSFAQTPPAAEAPAAAPAAVTPAPVHHHHEHFPELHKALKSLRAAKSDLEKAAHDYGGHKAHAIEAINHAMEEVQNSLDFAKSEK